MGSKHQSDRQVGFLRRSSFIHLLMDVGYVKAVKQFEGGIGNETATRFIRTAFNNNEIKLTLAN